MASSPSLQAPGEGAVRGPVASPDSISTSTAFTGIAFGDFKPGSPSVVGASERLVAALGGVGPLHLVSQVHGDRVATTGEGERAEGFHGEADALLTTTPGQVVAVRVADCVPIVLRAPGGAAAVHAGWRGTALDIARVALKALTAATGARPEQVEAVVGPAICGRCYEVGEEVIEGVSRVAPGGAWRDGRHVDLGLANTLILREEGVTVEHLSLCTRCALDVEEKPRFWSHRRDGARAGRQVGAIRCS